MRTTLICPPHIDKDPISPPMGLLRLAAVLEKDDQDDVSVIDFPYLIRSQRLPLSKGLYTACADLALDKKPDIIGFSTQSCTYPPSLNIAKICKDRNPRIKIIFGGPGASPIAEDTLRHFSFVDIIVRGESEETIKELVGAIKKNKGLTEVKGITFRANGKIYTNADRPLISNLDKLLAPAYHHAPPFSLYKKFNKMPLITATVDIGRGCVHNCIYCSSCKFWKYRVRCRSIPNILEEIRYLKKYFNVQHIYFTYDLFTANSRFIIDFCGQLIKNKLNISWECRGRIDEVNAELLQLMKEAGCIGILHGLESGSAKILSYVRKKFKIKQKQLFMNLLETSKLGINTSNSFVTGFPKETEKDLSLTLGLALQIARLKNTSSYIHIVTSLPGTDLAKINKNKFVLYKDTDFARAINFIKNKKLKEDSEIIRKFPLLFSSFYNIKTENMSLVKLHRIVSVANIIYGNFPKTFYVLSRESGKTFLQLINGMITFFKKKGVFSDLLSIDTMLPKQASKYFKEYLELTARNNLIRADYILELFIFESLENIETWKAPSIDASKKQATPWKRTFFPRINENIYIKSFAYNICGIADQNESGEVFSGKKVCKKKTYLILQFKKKRTNILQIDKLCYDVLRLCNGKRNMKDIQRKVEKGHKDIHFDVINYFSYLWKKGIVYVQKA